ncbi:helix-turn-helix transcriptional regulator [Comamonas sp. NyZ500]|uniref:S24 family peptidase n=1 Tax=Comamonas sp. NyZ500 TaxID=2795732 RepID=UPI00192CB079|nr:S24 family peptidase [Comamonas sp. NyZ500]MBL5978386.1 helix-turn-helix transcriptional regulator [Comamonas sp. NyZ500]
MSKEHRKAKVTSETVRESELLKAIWDRTPGKPNQAIFGETYDVGSQSAVTQFLNGITPLSLKAAVGFAKGLSCDISDFSPRLAAEASSIAGAAPQEDESEYVQIRHFAVKFSNGHGRLVHDESAKPALSFRADFIRKLGISQRHAVVVDSSGDSNHPLIQDGAVVLVDRATTSITNGKFYAFRIGGELLIKMLTQLEDGSILSISANPTYPPKILKENDDFEIIGRARWTCHEI